MDRLQQTMALLATTFGLFLLLLPQVQCQTAGACNGVDCQQGQCVVLSNNSYPTNILSPYECQCNPGWTTMESLVTGLPLLLTLPCTVPNCTLNIGCDGAPAPAVEAPLTLQNISSPCLLPQVCGNGQCVVTDYTKYPPAFECQCNPGYFNIGNLTAGYCVSSCELGASCSALGDSLLPPNASHNTGCRNIPVVGALLVTLALGLSLFSVPFVF
ncbi:unnamed protein product [Sphagnum balticum]